MHLAFLLATHITNPFVARTLARHILVRAENLIEHARGLRKPLKSAGYDTRHFHKTKETYADSFDEYFRTSRNKLGAHVQDFDFGKRIELWNDIEITKIGYFVEGARELYQSLANVNPPGYIAFTEPTELTDTALKELLQKFQQSDESVQSVEIGADSLAMTRENTTATLNMTPVHSRAAQLALIRRWVDLQNVLLLQLVAYPNLIRILKSRIITDIVSFSDCLITRPVTTGAPQALDGLDLLISMNGQSCATINNFLTVSNFNNELLMVRTIRDQIGAHLEIDNSQTMSSLIATIDGYSLEEALTFYGLIERVFIKTCFSIIYLRMYAADGQRMYGITTSKGTASVPFVNAADIKPIKLPIKPPINDEEAYRQNLMNWLVGNDDQRANARQLFWDAFSASETIETIEEKETFGASYRLSRNEFRKAHSFIFSTLTSHITDSDFSQILDLLLSCRNGWPYPLSEILVRYGRQEVSEFRQWLVCRALGEITSYPHASVIEFLEAFQKAKKLELRLESVIALFKIFVRSEGLFRINNRDRICHDYNKVVDKLMATMVTSEEVLLCTLAFASALSGPVLRTYLKPFADKYTALQEKIERLCIPYLNDDANLTKNATLQKLIKTDDYVGVCVLLAVDFEHDTRKQFREVLLDVCSAGSVVTTAHDQASRHLAMCFLLKKEHGQALKIAEDIATRNPDWLEVQILVGQIMGEMPGLEDKTTCKVNEIRQFFKVDASNEAHLSAIEHELSTR